MFDEQNQPCFKRADLGRYLGVVNMRQTFKNTATKSRLELSREGVSLPDTLGRLKNPHDAFVNLDAALEIVVRSRRPKAVELTKWLTHKGVEKVIEEHQKAIDVERHKVQEKDTQLALLNDDLTESQELVRHLEFNNTDLQGEIRAKDQEIARLHERVVPHAMNFGKNNVVMIVRKHTRKNDDCHFEFPYYISRIQRCKISTKRRWLLEQFPHSEEIVIIDNPNSVHAFNRFEEEGQVERFGCHFKLIDLTREDLYEMGVPAIAE